MEEPMDIIEENSNIQSINEITDEIEIEENNFEFSSDDNEDLNPYEKSNNKKGAKLHTIKSKKIFILILSNNKQIYLSYIFLKKFQNF